MASDNQRRKRAVIRRHGRICHLCGGHISRSTFSLDHVIPLSEGGSNQLENLRPAHKRCNGTRGSRPVPADGSLIFGPREGLCEDCNREYVVWSAPNHVWNHVMRRAGEELEPFLCASCFAWRAEAAGIQPTSWRLEPELGSAQRPATTRTGRAVR